MKRIDGTAIAQKVHEESAAHRLACEARIASWSRRHPHRRRSRLAAYVRSKDKKAADLGLHSVKHELPADTTQEPRRPCPRTQRGPAHSRHPRSIPPPAHINEQAVVETIDPRKDVDGFHPVNVAKLAMDDPTGFVPAPPWAASGSSRNPVYRPERMPSLSAGV